jgi:hypothetical protein
MKKAEHGKGKKRATCPGRRRQAKVVNSESGELSEGKWLTSLDNFRNWLGHSAAEIGSK